MVWGRLRRSGPGHYSYPGYPLHPGLSRPVWRYHLYPAIVSPRAGAKQAPFYAWFYQKQGVEERKGGRYCYEVCTTNTTGRTSDAV